MALRGEGIMQVHDGIYNHFSNCSLVKGGEGSDPGEGRDQDHGLTQRKFGWIKTDTAGRQIGLIHRLSVGETGKGSMILDYGLGSQVEGKLPSWDKAILISDGDRAKGSGWLQVPFKTFQIPALWTVCGIQKQTDATPKCWFCHEGPRPHQVSGSFLFIVRNRQDLLGCTSMKPGCGRGVLLAERCSVKYEVFSLQFKCSPRGKTIISSSKNTFFPPISLTVRIGTWPHSARLDNFKDIYPILVTEPPADCPVPHSSIITMTLFIQYDLTLWPLLTRPDANTWSKPWWSEPQPWKLRTKAERSQSFLVARLQNSG